MDFTQSVGIAFSGMNAQSKRLKVIAENVANADSISVTPGGEPYRRKIVTFKDVFDKSVGAQTVTVGKLLTSSAPFGRRYDPSNPVADAQGYIRTPNVNSTTELMDMREAQRGYEANLSVVQAAQSMLSRTIDLLRT